MSRSALIVAIALLVMAPCATLRTAWASGKNAPAVASVPAPAALSWSLEIPLDTRVPFSGVANFDNAGNSAGAMLYPAPNAIGLLAAVLTHAAIEKSSRNSEKSKVQKDADKVLDPYQPVLDDFLTGTLLGRGASLATVGAGRQAVLRERDDHQGWLVRVTPAYSMTQDQTTLVLDNVVEIYGPNERQRASYVNTIRVISTARSEQDMLSYWTRDQGMPLKEESAELLAASLDIAIADASRVKADPQFKTVRYMEGRAERVERGQLLAEQCGRVLLRSLRGTLMSAPIKTDETMTSSGCGDQTANTDPST
ncbi:hypothetical protein DVT68_11125 [Dyella solisilvae]|uniref:Lipoprotein n=1 Tax=Dyella solisilvae TaxID=1920168 RepID=A0A370K8R2_9GAMM|nr:hypothetical protein [Dyella solisilvae]RDI99032.1 hypothetical protein DVT68_11125 [Dyella solisilvae]